MVDDEIQRVSAIQSSMEEGARPAFDDEDIENLGILIRVTVEFYDYLTSTPPWPHVPNDPFHNMTYMIDKIFVHSGSFLIVLHLYCCLVDAEMRSTIDWNTFEVQSLKDRFLSIYQEFLVETQFERKFRLLLDLFKLEIVFAGAFYDCHP